MTDQLNNYLLSGRRARLLTVRLADSWQAGLEHQDLPEPVRLLLGELVAAATLLASNIKFDGSVVLQIQGDGPVSLLVAECTADLHVRATATLREHATIPPRASLKGMVNVHGNGRFIVVLDPRQREQGMQPYQGIVPLDGDTLAESLEHYMHGSEQLDTRLVLAATDTHSAGLLLQRLPEHGGEAPEATESNQSFWEELIHLLATVKHDELLDTPSDTLVHRLLWQHDVVAFDGQPVQWQCSCSRERVSNMLRSLGKDEVMSVLQEQASIRVQCHFCGKPYQFDAVDAMGLFSDSADPAPGTDPDPTIH